jgi:GGDEF domain-containing protein
MEKSIPYVFLGVSLLFFLFLVGLTGYRIESARMTNIKTAEEHGRELLTEAKALADSSGGFDSPFFNEKMRGIFGLEPRLLVLDIYSKADGILFLIARDRSYVREPMQVSPDWRGTPSYRASPGYETLLTLSFPSPTENVKLDMLFIILGREDLYPVVRDDLYLILAFLIVCAVFILIYAGVRDEEKDEYTTAPPAAAPGAFPDEKPPSVPADGRKEPFQSRLKYEIERAASSDQELSLAIVEIDNPPLETELPKLSRRIAQELKDALPVHEVMFETGKNTFALILPDTDVDEAVRALEKLRVSVAGSDPRESRATFSIGVSSRAGRLIDAAGLYEEASVSAAKAVREGGNRVIGFRADPVKFRESLGSMETRGILS